MKKLHYLTCILCLAIGLFSCSNPSHDDIDSDDGNNGTNPIPKGGYAPEEIKALSTIKFLNQDSNLDWEFDLTTDLDKPKVIKCEDVVFTKINGVLHVTELNLNNKLIERLDPITNFPELTKLMLANESYEYYGRLKELDLSKNTKLTHIDCKRNPLIRLDLSHNTELISLNLSDNNDLKALDISRCVKLVEVTCNGKLTQIDVSKFTELMHLNLAGNTQLKSLDVSKNTKLVTLYCDNTQITSLDISKNTKLATLYCYYTEISSLNTSTNTELVKLDLMSSKVERLDLKNNKKLEYLGFRRTKIQSIDLSNNIHLSYIDGSSTLLKELDLSKQKKLKYVSIYSNKFTEQSVIIDKTFHDNSHRDIMSEKDGYLLPEKGNPIYLLVN